MTRFRFRLQTLLKLREADRQQRRTELAQAFRAEELLLRQQGFLSDEASALRKQRLVALAPGEVVVENLLDTHRYALVLKARAALLEQQAIQVRQEIELRRQALAAADREVRVLEKLRERKLQQHRAEETTVEMKILDEVAQRRSRGNSP